MYTIELTTLLSLLKEVRKSGILTTNLPPTVVNQRATQAMVELVNGEVRSCRIVDLRGQPVLTEQEALRVLQRAGILEWQLHAQMPPAFATGPVSEDTGPISAVSRRPVREASPRTQPLAGSTPPAGLPSVPDNSPVPQRLVQVDPQVLNSWPRLHRRVYVLVDGRNSVHRIAHMLSLFPHGIDQVYTVMRDLMKIGAISLGNPL